MANKTFPLIVHNRNNNRLSECINQLAENLSQKSCPEATHRDMELFWTFTCFERITIVIYLD